MKFLICCTRSLVDLAVTAVLVPRGRLRLVDYNTSKDCKPSQQCCIRQTKRADRTHPTRNISESESESRRVKFGVLTGTRCIVSGL